MFVFELKISAILLNYPTFDYIFFILSRDKKVEAIELLYIIVHNKKLIKSEKTANQSTYAFWGQNRLKTPINCGGAQIGIAHQVTHTHRTLQTFP